MKALFLERPGKLVVRDVKKPSPGKGEVLVKMRCCGVCGTDLEKVRGEAVTPPVLGHEVVGEVSGVGEGVKDVEKGARVFTHHHVPCYICETCRRGEYTLCGEFPKHNIHPGGFSEFYLVPRWNVEKGGVLALPDSVNDDSGSFIEPLGCCLRGLAKIHAENHSSAIIYGAGPVGLLHLKLLRRYGYGTVVVADPSEYRLELARGIGAHATFNPGHLDERSRAFEAFDSGAPEIAIVATGNAAALEDAVNVVGRGGEILLFGAPPKRSTLQLDLASYFLSGVSIVPSYSTSEKEVALAAKILETKEIVVTDLVTHRFELSEAAEAFEIAVMQKCMKAVVTD